MLALRWTLSGGHLLEIIFLARSLVESTRNYGDDAIWEAEAIVTVPISTVLCLSLLPQGGIPLGELLRVSDHL